MINNNIPGLNQNAIQFVYRNLMIDLSEDDSSNAFRKYVLSNFILNQIKILFDYPQISLRLIHESLSKISTLNFAIHTLAQPKTLSSTNYFSFVTHIYK